MASNLEMRNIFDMYRWYIDKMVKDPEAGFFTEYDTVIRKKGICFLLKLVDGRKEIHMTYTWFRAIIERANMKAREAIISGQRYNLGSGLGYLEARRVERNFAKPKANIIATLRYRKENPGSKNVIYYTDDEYCRIGWCKIGRVKNESLYEFKACKDFRQAFSRANMENLLLKLRYTYFPLLDKSHGN